LSNHDGSLRVKAGSGPCPWPGKPGAVIGDDPVTVDNTRIIRRHLADGSLVIVTDDPPTQQEEATSADTI
jgi:hypothetical protein